MLGYDTMRTELNLTRLLTGAEVAQAVIDFAAEVGADPFKMPTCFRDEFQVGMVHPTDWSKTFMISTGHPFGHERVEIGRSRMGNFTTRYGPGEVEIGICQSPAYFRAPREYDDRDVSGVLADTARELAAFIDRRNYGSPLPKAPREPLPKRKDFIRLAMNVAEAKRKTESYRMPEREDIVTWAMRTQGK